MNTTAYVPFINEILSRTNNRDVMSDYYPDKVWIDTETGTFGGCHALVILDTAGWDDEDVDAFDAMSDRERREFADHAAEVAGGSSPAAWVAEQ